MNGFGLALWYFWIALEGSSLDLGAMLGVLGGHSGGPGRPGWGALGLEVRDPRGRGEVKSSSWLPKPWIQGELENRERDFSLIGSWKRRSCLRTPHGPRGPADNMFFYFLFLSMLSSLSVCLFDVAQSILAASVPP